MTKSDEVSDLKAKIAGLSVRIDNLESTIKSKDEEIKRLNSKSKDFKANVVRFVMEN